MKKIVLVVLGVFSLSSLNAHAGVFGGLPNAIVTTGGVSVGLGAAVMGGNPVAGAASIVGGLISIVMCVNEMDKRIAYVQQDALDYALGGELSPALAEMIQDLRDRAEAEQVSDVALASDSEIAAALIAVNFGS